MEPYIVSLPEIGAFIDDSVSMIKLKLHNNMPSKTAVEEMYICIKTNEYINVRMLYNMLTINQTVPLTYNSLMSYCECILDNIEIPTDIQQFTVNDLSTIFDDNHKYTIIKPLGLELSISSNIIKSEFIMLPVKPDITQFTNNLAWNGYTRTEYNESLVIKYITNIDEEYEVQLYVYSLSEFIKPDYHPTDISEFVKLYYPRMYTILGNDLTINSIKSIHEELIESSTNMYNINRNYFNNISAFNSVPMETTPVIDGITKVSMIYNNSLPEVFPMEYIFKTLHASELIPCIKYCKTRRSDQLIRVYQPNGIPKVSKANMIRMLNTTGKTPGISAIISLNQFIYVNNVDIEPWEEASLVIGINTQGNLTVYFETSNKYIILHKQLMSLIKQVMGFFSEIINNTIKSYYHKLPSDYTMLTGREITIIGLNYTLLFPNISMKSIMKVIPYLPATFSVISNTSEGELNINVGMFSMIYNRSYPTGTDDEKHTTVTLSIDKLSGKIIAEVINIPSMLFIPLIRDNMIKFMTITTNKPLFTNYSSSCVPGYDVYKTTRTIEADIPVSKISYDQPATIPISTLYSALNTDSDESTTSNMDEALNFMEILLERKAESDLLAPTDIDVEIDNQDKDINMFEDEDDIDLDDMGW
jgi:hypothetical protein